MAKKVKFNVFVDESLVKAFRAHAERYYGRVGMCLSAALLKFIELDPQEQADLLRRVFDIELKAEMAAAVEAAKDEQVRRIEERERRQKKK